MSRSLLQQNSAKKLNENDPLKSSRSRVLPGKLSNLTEVLVQTNDEDFPYIAIYKPDIKKEQRRVQSITIIERALRKFQIVRLQFVLGKLGCLRHQEQGVNRNIQFFQQLFFKMQNKRLAQAMLHLSFSRLKKKNMNLAGKAFNNIESKIRISNIKFCMNRLKVYNYQVMINTLSNQNELSRELTGVKNELFDLKAASYDKEFVEVTKTLQKLGDHNGFIDHIREVDYQNLAKTESTRFQQNRSKSAPKKKQPFESELVVTALSNTIKAYETCIADHINYEEELKQQLQGYTNTQGIDELNDMLKSKQAALNDLENFINEMAKMDAELKRFSGQKPNWEKIISLLPQQQKKLETRSKKSQGAIPKLYNSRVYLDTLITNAVKSANQGKEEIAQLLDELIEASKQSNTLRIFMKKLKDYPQIKSISTKYLNFTQKINQASNKLESLQSQKLNLLKQIEDLERQSEQNTRHIKEISEELQSLKDIQEMERSNIQSLQQFITENHQRLNEHRQLKLSIHFKILPHIQPLSQTVIKLLKSIYLLENQKQGYLKQIEQLQKRASRPIISETKPVEAPPSPKNTKIEIGDSEQSLTDRFMSPFKELLQHRHEDKELKQHILTLSQKVQEILCLNRLLHEKLLGLEASERTIAELTARMEDLKRQNNDLRKGISEFNEMHYLYEQSKERILFLTEENARLGHLANQAAQHEYRFRELSIVNAELSQHVISLRESNSQFNGIAQTNQQLSEKINQIYNRDPVQQQPSPSSPQKNISEGNKELLFRQTQLMQEILALKIELQNVAIRHLQEITALKNEINSYHTIISKYQVDITHREGQCQHKQSIIQSLNIKYQELTNINIQQRERIQQYEQTSNPDIAKKFKENQAQLLILRQDCQNLFTELQKNIEHLRVKDTHIYNLELNLGSQEQLVVNLRKQNERLLLNIQDLINKNEALQHENSRYKAQLNQAKSQLHESRSQYRPETGQNTISQSTVIFQKEIQDKQTIINNLLEQAKAQSASFTAQLQQLKQEHMSKERVFEERLAEKDVRISKLEFDLNEKLNTVMSLEQLISLYANTSSTSETIIKEETRSTSGPYSRDQEILYLRGQIKSLQEFLNDMTNQYHQLEKKYQQERERTNRAYLNLSPISPEKLPEGKTIFQTENSRSGKFLDDASDKFSHSFMSNINMTFTEGDLARQLSRLMASNESLATSVDHLRVENKELFMKVKSISSIDMVIELVFNILLTVRKLKHDSAEAAKIWHQLSHLRSVYSGEVLFQNLEDYCRSFVAA